MIPVEQTIMGGDSTMEGVHGDCLRACVASIFELPIAGVPHFVAQEDWYNGFARFVESCGFRLGNAFQSFADEARTRLNGHPSEGIYWIASVYSPRLTHEDGSPGQHAIVMRGGEIAWDPHPEREMGILGYVGIGYTFIAPDPARLVLRERAEAAEAEVVALRAALEQIIETSGNSPSKIKGIARAALAGEAVCSMCEGRREVPTTPGQSGDGPMPCPACAAFAREE